MGANLKSIALGILFASAMFIALFSFATTWVTQQDKTINPQLTALNEKLENNTAILYNDSKTHTGIAGNSKVYTGITELGIISADAYKVVKSLFITPVEIAQDTTTTAGQLNILPEWAIPVAITAFMILMATAFLAAVFRARGGII